MIALVNELATDVGGVLITLPGILPIKPDDAKEDVEEEVDGELCTGLSAEAADCSFSGVGGLGADIESKLDFWGTKEVPGEGVITPLLEELVCG